MKILVVDDSLFIRSMIKSILAENGHDNIAEGADGYDAITQYKEFKPDLVILDVTMPNKNGVEASKEILEFDNSANIIILSAITQEKYIMEALRLGVKEYLFKPLNSELLISTVKSVTKYMFRTKSAII